MRWRRRLLVIILAAAAAGFAQARRVRARRVPAAPEWPPLASPPPLVAPPPAADPPSTWRVPVDGACPDGYPVKANASSGIFHVPGGRFYDRTKPERCYATSADAERDGYRAAKA